LLVPEVNSSPSQDAEQACWSLHTNGACVRKRLTDQQPFGWLTVSVEWVLQHFFDKPLGSSAGFAPTSAGKCQCDEPVPWWWHLLRAGSPPPFPPVDFIEEVQGE
jgi:hypothetical protein